MPPPDRPGPLSLLGAPLSTRADKWLWAVRMYKTRSDATEACRAGHVKVNQTAAKPATLVKAGDRVEALAPSGARVLEVASILEKRSSPAVARSCYIDHTPPPPAEEADQLNFVRDRGSGRPTKKDRRALDRVRHH
ncbi:MAG TPA: RNA-binding S4 domain-containing protein [Acidimicrobiales bacterium]|nr:RNA-binding S4 domain-containing protein [Acidimicrobiales bacterium]